jgi:hypothetical protein
MTRRGTWAVIESIGDKVDTALWSLLIAFLIFFGIFVAPRVPENQAKQERIRALQEAAELSAYCQKFGKVPGTHEHTLCTLDLQEFRGKIEQRIAVQNSF